MSKQDWGYIFRILKDYGVKHKAIIVQVIVLSILEGIHPFILIVLMGYLLDAVYAGAQLSTMVTYAGIALGATLIFQLVEGRLRENYNTKNEFMVEQFNDMVNEKSLQLDFESLENIKLQELRRRMERAGGNFGLLGMVFENVENFCSNVVSMVVAIIIVLPLLFQYRPEAGWLGTPLVALALFVICGGLMFINYKNSVRCSIQEKKIMEEAQHEDNMQYFYMNHVLADFETQKDVRIYHQQGIIARDLELLVEKFRRTNHKLFQLDSHKEYLSQAISAVCGALVYLFAGLRAFVGMITVGSVVSYAATILRFTNSAGQLMSYMGYLQFVAQFCKDYVTYMDTPQRKYEGTVPVSLPMESAGEEKQSPRFEVEFDHVSFRYPGTDIDVMKDVNIKFTVGERMAIVGKNGSGKTTFIKLLCRLYDVTEGSIKLNGVDIRDYDYQQYMKLFSVVFQDFQMFSFELGENIAASHEVDETKAKDAIYRSGLKEKYNALPQGLNTYVGKEFDEQGVNFSGGERQKMAIARAIYKAAPFVIMDEPTAALDPTSECEVYEGFDRMVGSNTAIYISHRLASCRFCQDILVFDDGNVVERGNHEELVKKGGLYSQLWHAQAQYYQVEK